MRALHVGLAVTALALLPSAASAATVRQCGNYGTTVGQKPNADGVIEARFTMQQIDGAGIFNITAEVSSCKTARRIIRISMRQNNNPCVRYRDGLPSGARNPCRVIGFTCRSRQTGDESSATRCTRKGGRVVRWTSGA